MEYFFIFLLGLCIGSFLNAWMFRMRSGTSVWRGRSQCFSCHHRLAWYDLIPLVSFVLLRGKCRYCRTRIDIQYPLVEVATAVLFVIAYIQVPDSRFYILNSIFSAGGGSAFGGLLKLIIQGYFIAVLVVIFVYDLRYMLIPDRVTIPAIVIGFMGQVVLAAVVSRELPGISFFLRQLVVPVLVGGGFFLLQFVISRGRWIGGGDIRLGALMGVIVGWPGIIAALMIAYVAGALIAIPLVIAGKKSMQSRVPFGTFLAAATIVVMMWGNAIIAWYSRLFMV